MRIYEIQLIQHTLDQKKERQRESCAGAEVRLLQCIHNLGPPFSYRLLVGGRASEPFCFKDSWIAGPLTSEYSNGSKHKFWNDTEEDGTYETSRLIGPRAG